MAAATPAKKIQLRPDFFRGQHSTDESPSAKKSTRIPFIGRPRKKSTHSDILPSVATAQVTQSRTSVATVGSRSNFDNAGDGLASPPLASTSQQSLKATSNSTSLGSRLAAHFTPRTSLRRFQSRRSQPSLHSPGELSDYTSDSLAPPKSGPRSPSIDSTSSRLSRSSTPRATQSIRDPLDSSRLPAQPTITVSRPPPLDYDLDNLDEYSDLFTKPRRKIKPKPVPINTRPLKYTEDHHSYAPLARSSSPPSALTFSREPHAGGQIANSHKPFAPDADSTSISGNPIPSSRALATGRRDSSPARHASDIDTAEDSEAMSIKSVMSMPTSFGGAGRSLSRQGAFEKRRSLATTALRDSENFRSRMLQPSKPPSIPLPATPTPPGTTSFSSVARQRAHTISTSRTTSLLARSSSPSIKNGALSKRDSTTSKEPLANDNDTSQVLDVQRTSSSSSSSSSTPTITKILPDTEIFEIDIDKASIDDLRKALRIRNKQVEELSAHLLGIIDARASERRSWEEKVTTLEKEAENMKRSSSSLNNDRGDATEQSGSRTPSLLEVERERSDDSSRSSLPTPASSIRLPLQRVLQGEDSGAESYLTSNSDWGTSLATIKSRRPMRKLKLVESVNKRSLTQPGPGSLSSGSDVSRSVIPSHYLSKLNKRSSASSTNSLSVTSSASSLENSPTAITFPATLPLNPIPESRNMSILGSRENHASISPSGKEEAKRERRPSKVSFKPSGQLPTTLKPIVQSKSLPSVTPGSRLTPSEAYVQNLKKGRPPSIAQVLNQTQKAQQMSNIEDSYGGRSRALLTGTDRLASD